jgi:uncharacterized protein (TIGR02246 family)
MYRCLLAGVLGLLASPHALAQETPDALLAAFIAAVEAEDSQALAALYLPEADSYSPGSHHVRGREAIAADWQGFFDAFDQITLDIQPHGSEHFGSSHAAWGVWTLTQTPAGGGEAFSMDGRFMDVQRQVDGRWYYIADHASVALPSAEAE